METKKRLKRFKRESHSAPRLVLQPRDFEIIKSLADYRFLDTQQILALYPGGERNMKRRLQKLFHTGFIDRPPHQLSYHKPMGPMIYALGNRGAELLSGLGCLKKNQVDWTTKNREVKDRYIQHAMMISGFRAVLTLALRKRQDVSLERWQQGKELKDYVLVDGQKIAIVPDAFFTLSDSFGFHDYFMEADQSTMTQDRFLRKMKAYWRWFKDNGHQHKFGIDAFRVLTLCKTEARKDNLRSISRDADERRTGLRMFYFSTQDQIDLNHPETILDAIWQTPRDNNLHALLN